MIQGEVKQDNYINAEEVFRYTNLGYDVFRYYIGKVARLMDRPWPGERKESKPSWGINFYNGTWVWVDNARGESGNAITFVQRYFGGLTYPEALQQIANDFGIKGGRMHSKSTIVNWVAPTAEERKEYCHIAFTYKPWGKEHHKFWENTGVTEEHCLKYEVYAVKQAAINHRRVRIGTGEVVWCYYAPEEDSVKLYFPEREGSDRFRTNVSGGHLWNFSNLEQNPDTLYIQKSCKDMLVHLLHTPNVIATQSEKSRIFDPEINPELFQKVNNKAKTKVIVFGSDKDGRKKSKDIVTLTGWSELYTPVDLLPEVNDLYGYAKKFGPKKTEEFLKQLK